MLVVSLNYRRSFMKILLTNDDGWNAPGLAALAKAAQEFGDVWVVAPASHMSGISHQVTWERPLQLEEKSNQSFSLDGTPADCVRIGTTQLGIDFDWVFSGVNNGANLGTDIYVSGTVAATREAVMQGYKSIAFSQHRLDIFDQNFDWTTSELMAKRMIPLLISAETDRQPQYGINVNFPQVAQTEVEQVAIVDCNLDRTPLPLAFQKDEQGRFVSCAVYNQRKRVPGNDIAVCFDGAISVTEIDMQHARRAAH